MKPAIGTCRVMAAAALAAGLLSAAILARAQTGDIRVVVEQTYETRGPFDPVFTTYREVDLPILDLVDDMIFAIGGHVVDAQAAGADRPELTVSLTGRALGRRYLERDNQYLYTGASIGGDVWLRTAAGNAYHRMFNSLTPMPFQLATVNLGYDQPYNAPFSETLEKTDGLARAIAEVIVAAWGIEAIIPAVLDADETARADVASLLGDMGDTVAVPALIEALELDDSEIVRQRAAWSLGRIGDSRAIPALIEALNDGSGDVRWFAAWSLRTITGEDLGADYEAWSDWWDTSGGKVEG